MPTVAPFLPSQICPLTGDPMAPWFRVPRDWRRPASDLGYDLYWSHSAEFGQVRPRPTPAEIAEFYAVDYYTHGARAGAGREGLADRICRHLAWRVDAGIPMTAARFRTLAAESVGPKALEIGCGDGGLLAALRADGWVVAGVEPDPAARAAAVGRGLEVYPGVAEELPIEVRGRRYDLVVLMHVLEHCLDPIRALRAAGALLKPGGAVVVEVPNNAAVGLQQAEAVWPWLDVPRHLNFFTPKSLSLACGAAGLTVGHPEFVGYSRQFSGEWRATEQAIRAAFGVALCQTHGLRSWWLLLRTAFAASARKYDSVRVVARPAL
jgi:SAM-dependent methyltransferase